MQLTFNDLADKLPAGSVEFVGNNQVKLNLNLISESNLTLNSSIVEPIVKLLRGLANLTDAINQEKATQGNTLIEFAEANLVGTAASPEYQFAVRVKVNTSLFPDNLVDPTANAQ
jgi:hypothetical protein